MTQFSSGKHAKLTEDEFPWRTPTGTRGSKRLPKYAHILTFDPRPEFDRPLTNPANPILDHYRKRESTWPIDGYLRSLTLANSWQWEPFATAEQVKHALNVLSRLAALREDA